MSSVEVTEARSSFVCMAGVAVHRGGRSSGRSATLPGDPVAGPRAGPPRPSTLHPAGPQLQHVPEPDGTEQPHSHLQLGAEVNLLQLVSFLFLHLR